MADPANLPPLPADHLDHPEQWATGAAPATGKQKGFVKVLERQHPDLVPGNGLKVDEMGKSEASEIIDQLKNGRYAGPAKREDDSGATKPDETPQSGGANGKTKEEKVVEELDEQVKVAEKEKKVGEKRKDAPAEKTTRKVVNNGDADDEDSGVGGKDVKRTKQTTLDGVMGSGAGSQGADDEKEDGVRRVKKARVDVDEVSAALISSVWMTLMR